MLILKRKQKKKGKYFSIPNMFCFQCETHLSISIKTRQTRKEMATYKLRSMNSTKNHRCSTKKKPMTFKAIFSFNLSDKDKPIWISIG